MMAWVTVVQVKTGGDMTNPSAEVIVLAVDGAGTRVEWRTTERPQIGERYSVELGTPVRSIA